MKAFCEKCRNFPITLVILAQQPKTDPDLNQQVKGTTKTTVTHEGDRDCHEDGVIHTCKLAAKPGHTHKETEEKEDGVWLDVQ